MKDFNGMIMDCNLIDIGFTDNNFMWNRGHLWQRMDRDLFNNAWINAFESTHVEHLSRTLSNHAPLLIKINLKHNCSPSHFRFQNMWLLHDSFLDVVKTNSQAPLIPDNSISDNNTKYFHALVKKKHAKNTICKIHRDDGSITEDYDEIVILAVNHFKTHLNKIFIPSSIINPHIIPKLISKDNNKGLTIPPSLEEVKDTVFGMNGNAMVGPDGFTTKFFNKYWPIIYEDIFAVVTDFFNGGAIPKFFTATSIVLIPKNNLADSWNDFRPISLCSFFYKFISKILMNRLFMHFPRIILPFQMGFVKSHPIVDNILLAQEFCQYFDAKVRGGNMILKLDIAKVYDNINWEFIYKILSLFGFDFNFIKLIKNCIESLYFSIMVNGKSHDFFKASHGLGQGDLISPALFIITADYLSRGLKDLFSKYPGLYFRTLGCFKISHLYFADDFIIFFNASLTKINKLWIFLTNLS
ncbi:integrator complex subunit 11 [Dendrobium catenatum]|uniref:Integrator complex subunit 11 n=1 Tax=Dendrobium catenatum TaxID=906689 RepID=A0A2I0WPN6_9ASPA|nr:integrator complex subunit 11 [Dendrobium catenatum]